MALFGEVVDLHCVKCDADCENEETLIGHCWQVHGEAIGQLLKHRPLGYQDETVEQMFGLGVTCINEIAAGHVWHGSIACAMCKIGFDHPGELFIHLFHRHSRIYAVRSGAVPEWPIRADRLDRALREVLQRWCCDSACRALMKAEVFGRAGDQYSCLQCCISFKDNLEMWGHIEKSHLVILF
jgi:hypothetical protein